MRRLAAAILLGLPVALIESQTVQADVPSSGLASSPSTLTFRLDLSGSPRTWSASGLVSSSGTWRFADFDATGSIVHSPVVGSAHDTFVLTSFDYSSITIEDQALFTLSGFEDQWRISAGTGRFAGLQGQGSGTLGSELTLFGLGHYLHS